MRQSEKQNLTLRGMEAALLSLEQQQKIIGGTSEGEVTNTISEDGDIEIRD